ncbi:zinc finger CCHC domain-containing protein 8 isoform X2 [Nematolebias whitei]|uniref:zinc finger CCHC domain-containing protein 8 isoform X2 n=1 Tax=Nematolebias whitei TaxID=451745 RepID=UPI00189A221F|nr:zinc finger CCHC domain-containing protein 8 isoform X2 [Nematolebias whitei]
MAEVDFGDTELFEQLEDSAPFIPRHIRFTNDDEENQEESNRLQIKLEECEANVQKLSEENRVLQRKLNILTRPSGITVDDVGMDGPFLQILYANNVVSKQCRQEIEDCVCNVIHKHQKPSSEKQKTFHMKPQSSAFALDEDPQKLVTSSVRTTTEAFKVVGSVLYFATFSVDKLGQPLVNENPQLTDGWDVPVYLQVFNLVIGAEGQEIEMKDKRPKSMCFNCGSSSHQLRDCPKPKDMTAINERRKEFNQNNQVMVGNQRYHAEEVEERFARFKPGVISEELLAALGVKGNTLPPLIYRMRQLGYPPGWLKDAEMENSGLFLYDGNASNNGGETQDTSQSSSYDVSKLVDFPGFNVAAPHNMKDEFMHYGSIPMQSSHMKQNYAAYLSNSFPLPGAACNKRQQESDSSPQLKKKLKSSPDRISDRSSDMDIESGCYSDPGTVYSTGDFQFQSPLPPGSPSFSSPPPLPEGTPPSTPIPPPLPKGTPPPTPTNGSPALEGRTRTVVNENEEEAEDELTLEELEEQQRLIWAALQNADSATNSDSETPALGTPVPSSPSVSTSVRTDTETEEVEESTDKVTAAEPCSDEKWVQEIDTQSPGPVKVKEESPQSPEPVKSQDDSPQSPDPDMSNLGAGEGPQKQVEKITGIPHRSRFAAGIVPFENTPEFTEVAEATGTYLKIRDLLKCSPRSLAKKN